MVNSYVKIIESPIDQVSGQIFNVGYQNLKVKEIAELVKKVIDDNSCKEGSIIGGLLGAGITMSATRGKDRWWAVPVGGTAGALIGCQIDGG